MSTLLDHRRLRRISVLAALSVAGGLLAAPTAQAAPASARVVATIGTLSFDGGDDTVLITNVGGLLSHGFTGATTTSGEGFNSELDWDTLLPGDQTLAASALTETVLNGGDGRDSLTAPQGGGDVLKATLNGEGGDDLLTGSRAGDDLRGGGGGDRLVGFAGDDDMEGGEGDDTLAWNDGDGTDIMDGDLGNDGVEVNGSSSAPDAVTIAPAAGARVALARSAPAPFALDILAERLDVNGLGGDDTIAASGALATLVLLRLDGGTGKDTLTGADGPDLLFGDERDDTLNGGAGDDRIAGDRGNDTMNGGDGDDTLAWSNGDNNDVVNGDDGRDVVEVNGSPTAGDSFTAQPDAARMKLERTNLVAFTLDIGTAEAMALRGLGGDDTIGVGEVGPFQVTGDGGAGNDSLTGGGGAETFLGGSGNDAISPGLGIDSVSGDEGDDTIAVRDGLVDFARCGAGTDQVTADAVALDAGMDGCETVDRPPVSASPSPAPGTTAPSPTAPVSPSAARASSVTISASTVKLKKGKGKIAFACPASSTAPCRVRVNLLAGATASGIDVVVVLARASFELRPGEARNVRIKVPKRAPELANRKGQLSVLAVATTTGASGNATRTQRLTLDFGKPKRTRKRSS